MLVTKITRCMHVITEIRKVIYSNRRYILTNRFVHFIYKVPIGMARNERTLVDLEEEKKFLFNYGKKIERGKKFIRRGKRRQAIVRERVKQKIRPLDPYHYERLMRGEIGEEDIRCEFWYSPEGDILPYFGITISYFTNLMGVYFC